MGQLTAFLVAGLGGYLFIGDRVAGMLDESLPFGVAFQVAAVCLVTHMLISYLIKGIVWCKALHCSIDAEYAASDDKRCRSLVGWCAIVAFTLFAAWLLANVVPFFGAFVDLL